MRLKNLAWAATQLRLMGSTITQLNPHDTANSVICATNSAIPLLSVSLVSLIYVMHFFAFNVPHFMVCTCMILLVSKIQRACLLGDAECVSADWLELKSFVLFHARGTDHKR
ncbi:hypothetical protein GGI43DRAFT_219249 [Trichoderma evansii]